MNKTQNMNKCFKAKTLTRINKNVNNISYDTQKKLLDWLSF